MLHQLFVTVLLPLVTTLTSVPNEPIIVEDPQLQDICYVMPARCEKRVTGSNNG